MRDGDRTVVVTTYLERPPEVVFDFIADPANDARWCPTVSEPRIEAMDEAGLGVYRFVQHLGPLRHGETAKIVESVRPTRLRWQFTTVGSDVEATIELRPEGTGTRLIQTNRISRVGRLRWPIQRRIAERELPRQHAALKAVLEDA